jgi:CyaY protein
LLQRRPRNARPAVDSQQYRLLADQCFARISAKLDGEDPDEIEVSAGDGFLTLEFGDGAKFIVSRQSATHQIWVAAGARAWHYSHDPNKNSWADDKDGHDLYARLSETVSAKLGRKLAL